MNKSRFIREVTRQLEALYRATKSGVEQGAKVKHRCEGFMQAGEFLQIVTKEELTDIMEKTHIKVFGETFEQRKKRLVDRHQWPKEVVDYREFETPTYGRKK